MEEVPEQISVENLVSRTKRLGWQDNKVRLEVDIDKEDKAKLLLIGKILSKKYFPRTIVKYIVVKTWNVVCDVEVRVADRNIFIFEFKHEVDLRRAWDRRPWSIKGEHLILKKFNASLSLNEVDFTSIEFWIQIYRLLLNRQKKENLLKIRGFVGRAIDTNLSGKGSRFVRVRVEVDVNCPLYRFSSR